MGITSTMTKLEMLQAFAGDIVGLLVFVVFIAGIIFYFIGYRDGRNAKN